MECTICRFNVCLIFQEYMLQRSLKILTKQVRFYYNRSEPKEWAKDGVKYGLVTYYPRYTNKMLHMQLAYNVFSSLIIYLSF